MNSNQPKPAPTAEEQLPPYDERYVELTEDLGSEELDADVKIRLAHDCRERQLLAALAERDAALRSNREKDAKIAELEKDVASSEEQIEALEQKYEGCPHKAEFVCACSYDFKSDVCAVHAPALRAARAQLRALSEALKNYYAERRVDVLLARLRSIVDGKD